MNYDYDPNQPLNPNQGLDPNAQMQQQQLAQPINYQYDPTVTVDAPPMPVYEK